MNKLVQQVKRDRDYSANSRGQSQQSQALKLQGVCVWLEWVDSKWEYLVQVPWADHMEHVFIVDKGPFKDGYHCNDSHWVHLQFFLAQDVDGKDPIQAAR